MSGWNVYTGLLLKMDRFALENNCEIWNAKVVTETQQTETQQKLNGTNVGLEGSLER